MAHSDSTPGILLPCPCCGEPDATIHVSLADTSMMYCQECNAEFTPDFVRDIMSRWQPVLAWLENIPRS